MTESKNNDVPRRLVTFEDYASAPLGTIVAYRHEMPWTRDETGWNCNGTILSDEELHASRSRERSRLVLRYAWDGYPMERDPRRREYAVAVATEPETWKYVGQDGRLTNSENFARWFPLKVLARAVTALWPQYPARIVRRFFTEPIVIEQFEPGGPKL